MDAVASKAVSDPFARFLGIRVERVEEGFASCSVTIGGDLCNFLGMVHGGLIFSLADVAFGAASNRDHYPSYALDVSGSFLKTARVGDVIRAEARLVHSTRRIGLYRMDVYRQSELVATFNGTVFRKVDGPNP
ncbi:MAG: PaaI family thioesterase [Desulfomonilia bacterium]|jgi:acyl-CoA thioesterase|nr:PaaI family thioesterase [Deltaproteobacteria bacterium]MDX9761235.1 PaaI family thioesterase [Desulfomonilia bacterium]